MTADSISSRALVQASLLLTAAAFASRILGWLRLAVIGSQFGASADLDAYFAAFRIPDAIFQLVVAGALSAALIPVYAAHRARGEERESLELAASIINMVVIALAAISLVMVVLAPWVVPLITPGFDDATTDETIRLTQIMLLSPVFIGTGAVVSGILNTHGRFGVAATAPLAYNLAIIAAAVFLAPQIGVEGLAIGVVIGSILHLAIQLPAYRRVRPKHEWRIGLREENVRRVGSLMAPRTLGLAAGQLNYVASTIIASGLVAGSLTAYNYAFQLSQLPVGIIGVSVAVALFPTFSRDAALGRVSEIRRQVNGSLRTLIFIAAPLTAVLIVLRDLVASVFFEYGRFTAESAALTAQLLGWFAIGLTAHVVVHVLTRAFYAMQDTRLPVAWAVLAVVLNVGLMIALVGPMGVGGLALALSISASVEVLGLLFSLRGRIGSLDGARLAVSAGRSAAGALLAGAAMFGGLAWFNGAMPDLAAHGLGRLVQLLLLTALGGLAYLAFSAVFRAPELTVVATEFRRRFGSAR
jgi:putative peptidoglycan lipid II flippase